jgi:hypothetical protein
MYESIPFFTPEIRLESTQKKSKNNMSFPKLTNALPQFVGIMLLTGDMDVNIAPFIKSTIWIPVKEAKKIDKPAANTDKTCSRRIPPMKWFISRPGWNAEANVNDDGAEKGE